MERVKKAPNPLAPFPEGKGGQKARWLLLVLFALVLTANGCSDVKDNVTGPTQTSVLSVHPEGWLNSEHAEFHGQALAKVAYDMSGCRSCHGEDYRGGISHSDCTKCHENTPEDCATCHGNPPAEPHPQVADCNLCHSQVVGEAGNIVNQSLHVNNTIEYQFAHPNNYVSPLSENFHGLDIRQAGWSMDGCQTCHGQDYRGTSFAQVSCLTCHQESPEDCAVCHGSDNNAAPPEDIDGHQTTDFRGVGAHQTHLNGGFFAGAIECAECHNVPARYDDPGHIDSDLPAEVVFGSLAKMGGANPVWNGETCSNTYCHGSAEPKWQASGTGESICSSCHAIPPPAPHPDNIQCSLCHQRTVDENLIIIDKTLHINGQVEVGP